MKTPQLRLSGRRRKLFLNLVVLAVLFVDSVSTHDILALGEQWRISVDLLHGHDGGSDSAESLASKLDDLLNS